MFGQAKSMECLFGIWGEFIIKGPGVAVEYILFTLDTEIYNESMGINRDGKIYFPLKSFDMFIIHWAYFTR
jgi:hypothetical protein